MVNPAYYRLDDKILEIFSTFGALEDSGCIKMTEDSVNNDGGFNCFSALPHQLLDGLNVKALLHMECLSICRKTTMQHWLRRFDMRWTRTGLMIHITANLLFQVCLVQCQPQYCSPSSCHPQNPSHASIPR
uniref:Uncharacterized protein n=1 Tax=Opuntia streptacantha TaxID=393608 RepID=A0A7C9CL33_OPUST